MPVPPQAPGFIRPHNSNKVTDQDREISESKKTSPPKEQGPTQVWFKHTKRGALQYGIIAFLIITVGLALVKGISVDWITSWWVWLYLVACFLGFYYIFRSLECAVGAEWLKAGGSWVRLYELTYIKAKHRGVTLHLDFKDSGGRTVMVQAEDIQLDRRMWDYIYNGILHSVVLNNAETNNTLHRAFKVPRREDYQ